MIVAPDKSHVSRHQNLAAENNVALDRAAGTKLHVVSQRDSAMGRIEPDTHRAADVASVRHPAIEDPKLDGRAHPIRDLAEMRHHWACSRPSARRIPSEKRAAMFSTV